MTLNENLWEAASSTFTTYSVNSPRNSWSSNISNGSSTPLSRCNNSYTNLQTEIQNTPSASMSLQLQDVLRQYILLRCSLNEYCNEIDFDSAALEALARMPMLQALQTIEHYSSSVSARIQKKSAYLMGILRGQEAHWEKLAMNNTSCKVRELFNIPSQLILIIGRCCIQGNCLPSDFTPEVCMSLNSLPLQLAIKAVGAYNSNKRIVAGAKGGVINRSRFFLRLIQNVAEQSQTNVTTRKQSALSFSSHSTSSLSEVEELSTRLNDISIQASPNQTFENVGVELNLEELADIQFNTAERKEMNASTRIMQLECELKARKQREHMLLVQMDELERRLLSLQTECHGLKKQLYRSNDITSFHYTH